MKSGSATVAKYFTVKYQGACLQIMSNKEDEQEEMKDEVHDVEDNEQDDVDATSEEQDE